MTEILASRAAGLKLAAIIAVLLLPMGLLAYLMVSGLRADIAAAEREMKGIALNRIIMPVTVGAMVRTLDPAALEPMQTAGAGLAAELGTETALRDAQNAVDNAAGDLRNAVPALVRLQKQVAAASGIAIDPDAENYHLGALFSDHVPATLAGYVDLDRARSRALADDRLTTGEATGLLVAAGAWLDAHHQARETLQQARRSSTMLAAYDEPSQVLRAMLLRPREAVSLASQAVSSDQTAALKSMPLFAAGADGVISDAHQLWSFAIDRFEANGRARINALTQRLYWMLGLAAGACLIALGGAALMFQSTLRRLDELQAAREQAELARRDAEKSAADVRQFNEEMGRLNGELSQNLALLREAQDASLRKGKLAQLGQLTATVAHELRNPLGAVRTSAFLLDRKLKGKGLGIEPQLERINNGVTRCDTIISQLLDFARTKTLQLDTLEFDDWLAKLVEEEAQRLPAAVSIDCRLTLGGQKVAFDPSRMSRVLINLISNASEALVGKGDDPKAFASKHPLVSIESRMTERGVELIVKDNGPGISAENIERIFEPLFTTKNFGTGLGLPAIQKILEQHGGGLEVTSEIGHGATFTAWWPALQEMKEAV